MPPSRLGKPDRPHFPYPPSCIAARTCDDLATQRYNFEVETYQLHLASYEQESEAYARRLREYAEAAEAYAVCEARSLGN